MSCFIIIRGPAGIGKSTVAKQLSALLKGLHISFDEILKENGLDYVAGEKWVPEYKMFAANKVVIPKIREHLEENRVVIFDGNFYHKSQIEDLIAKLQFPFFIFTLKANLRMCLARNKTKLCPLDEQAIKDVFALVSNFDYGIVLDTNGKTTKEIVREIVRHLKS